MWYGRMYLPPEDALLPGENRSFAELRASEERAAGVTRWANNVSNENVRPSLGLEAVSRRRLVDKVRWRGWEWLDELSFTSATLIIVIASLQRRDTTIMTR